MTTETTTYEIETRVDGLARVVIVRAVGGGLFWRSKTHREGLDWRGNTSLAESQMRKIIREEHGQRLTLVECFDRTGGRLGRRQG